jgi:hypothetical protein
MLRWQTLVGVLLGWLGGLALLSFAGNRANRPVSSGSLLSECDGQLRELVVHYEPTAKQTALPVYRDFLGALESNVTVHVLCPDQAAFDQLAAALPALRCRLAPHIVKHPITTWSRDRWVALAPARPGSPTTLYSPRAEAADEIWPARAGDERVGADLAAALTPAVAARHSALYFDGGDFLADSETVFVVPRVLQRNIQHTVGSREEFLRLLSSEFKRRVILLNEAPDHHAGMFMASVGNRTMLVGDPSLAKPLLPPATALEKPEPGNEFMHLPGGPDFRPQTQHLFDAVAAQCSAAGYRVIRIPVVPACDGRTYLTYNNVLLDQQTGHRVVYLPTYRGVEALNAAARGVWESLGYQMRLVDCTETYRHFGCLHCLVNILRRA